jgi:hypothetical protein
VHFSFLRRIGKQFSKLFQISAIVPHAFDVVRTAGRTCHRWDGR